MTRFLTVFFSWVFVYVIVTGTLIGFQKAGLNMALPMQTFILTAVLVPSMVFVLVPTAAKLAKTTMQRLGAAGQ